MTDSYVECIKFFSGSDTSVGCHRVRTWTASERSRIRRWSPSPHGDWSPSSHKLAPGRPQRQQAASGVITIFFNAAPSNWTRPTAASDLDNATKTAQLGMLGHFVCRPKFSSPLPIITSCTSDRGRVTWSDSEPHETTWNDEKRQLRTTLLDANVVKAVLVVLRTAWSAEHTASSCHLVMTIGSSMIQWIQDPIKSMPGTVHGVELPIWKCGDLVTRHTCHHVPFWLVRRPTKLKMHALSSSCEHKNSKHPTALFQPTLRPNFRCKWRLHSNFPDLPKKTLKNRSPGRSCFCMGRGQIFCAELRGNTLVSRWIPAAVDASTVVSRWSDLVKWQISEDSGFYLSQHSAVQNSNKEITLPSNLRMTTCDTLGWHRWHIGDASAKTECRGKIMQTKTTLARRGWWQGRWSLHLNCLWRSDLICISRRPGPRFQPLSKLLKSHTTWNSFWHSSQLLTQWQFGRSTGWRPGHKWCYGERVCVEVFNCHEVSSLRVSWLVSSLGEVQSLSCVSRESSFM